MPRLESLTDFARLDITLPVRCRNCGKVAIIPSERLLAVLLRKPQRSLSVRNLAQKFRCVGCGAKDAEISP